MHLQEIDEQKLTDIIVGNDSEVSGEKKWVIRRKRHLNALSFVSMHRSFAGARVLMNPSDRKMMSTVNESKEGLLVHTKGRQLNFCKYYIYQNEKCPLTEADVSAVCRQTKDGGSSSARYRRSL